MKNIIGSLLVVGFLTASIVSAQDSIPQSGTFFLQSYGAIPAPYPFDPYGGLEPMETLDASNRVYLILDTPDDFAAMESFNSSSRMSMMSMDSPFDFGGGSGGEPNFPQWSPPTNGELWLEITNVSNGAAYLNLHNATNTGVDSYGGVYEIFSKTNLLQSDWDVASEVFPTDTNCQPFNLSLNSQPSTFFVWARDWTGITSGDNTAPDWWLWKYFGTVDVADTNLDGDGNALIDDYQYGGDPNIISFSTQLPNGIYTNVVNGSVNILGGVPFYQAILVDDMNFNDAVWQPYSGTNITISFPSNGLYTVSVGLRGLPDDAQQTWMQTQVSVFMTTPIFLIANPVSAIVSTPLIQVQGLINESLSTLTYNVSNALEVITNQQGYWQPVFFDENASQFTTNSFQLYDVPMTNGLNTITIYATDLAGNAVTTNFNVTLDYSSDTTPPVLDIVWPTNGTTIAASNFTMQAQMDDATATVEASMNGDTNLIQGIVERDGIVSINLPLDAGTNTVSIIATDAAGNSFTTNLTLIQSSVIVSVDPISSDQANQSSVTVTGNVSDPTSTVTVNGQSASVDPETGDWEADGVPVNASGTANLNVQVGDPYGNPVAATTANQAQPTFVTLMSFNESSSYYTGSGGGKVSSVKWNYSTGGNWYEVYWNTGDNPAIPPADLNLILPDDANYMPQPMPSHNNDPFTPTWHNADFVLSYGSTYAASIQTTPMIVPSGPKLAGVTKTYVVSASAMGFDPIIGFSDGGDGSWYSADVTPGAQGNVPIPPDQIKINGQPLDANGSTTVTALAGVPVPLTVTASGEYSDDYTFNIEIVQDKTYWQQMVQAEIDTDSGVVIENYLAGNGFMNNRQNIKAVYSFYQKLFTEQPLEFYWAGLAKLAGAPVYAGLSDAEHLLVFSTFQQTLISMNIAIMNDLAWQFEAYEKGGLDAIKEIDAVDPTHTIVDIDTWQEIDDGVQNNNLSEVQDGNKLLLQREQQIVLADGYTKLNGMVGISSLMSFLAKNPIPTGFDFSVIEPSGNICVYADRWDWITKPTYGMWWLWLGTSLDTQLEWVEIPLKTRASDYALFSLY